MPRPLPTHYPVKQTVRHVRRRPAWPCPQSQRSAADGQLRVLWLGMLFPYGLKGVHTGGPNCRIEAKQSRGNHDKNRRLHHELPR